MSCLTLVRFLPGQGDQPVEIGSRTTVASADIGLSCGSFSSSARALSRPSWSLRLLDPRLELRASSSRPRARPAPSDRLDLLLQVCIALRLSICRSTRERMRFSTCRTDLALPWSTSRRSRRSAEAAGLQQLLLRSILSDRYAATVSAEPGPVVDLHRDQASGGTSCRA